MLTKRLKLKALSEAMLRDKEMGCLMGGCVMCTCSCLYTHENGITSEQNSVANYHLGDYGGYSTAGCNNYWTTSFDNGPVTGPAPNYQNLHA